MQALDKFYDIKSDVTAILKELSVEAHENGLSVLAENADSTHKRIHSDKFIVAVVGVLKRGKSTLLNALLKAETDILSTMVTPDTARLSYLEYSEKPYVIIHAKNGNINIDIEELPEYTSAYDVIGGRGIKEKVDNTISADIFYPNDILQKGICIVDTPGIDDPDEMRSNVTMQFIDKADVVVFLMNAAEGGLKDFELKFLQSKVFNEFGSAKGTVLVSNMISRLRQRQLKELEPLIDKNKQYIKEIFGVEIPIFPLDGLDALMGIRNNDSELYLKSRFDDFRNYLETFLVSQKGKLFLRRRLKKFVAEELNHSINLLREMISSKPRSIEEVETQLKQSQQNIQTLEQKSTALISKYDKAIEALIFWLKKEIMSDFNTNVIVLTIDIKTLPADINRTTQGLQTKVKKRVKTLIEDLLYDYSLENIKLPSPDFDVPPQSLNTEKYFRIEKVIKAKGFFASLFDFFFGGSSSHEEVVKIDEKGLLKEISKIKDYLTDRLSNLVYAYFDDVKESIEKDFATKRLNIETIYNQQKKTLSMEQKKYSDFVVSTNNKINMLSSYKNRIETLLKEIESL